MPLTRENFFDKLILSYEKKITDNGKFTLGLTAKNTNQDARSINGNFGFKTKFLNKFMNIFFILICYVFLNPLLSHRV